MLAYQEARGKYLLKQMTVSYVYVGADAGWTAEVEVRSLNAECVTGTRVAVTVKSAAFTAIH